MFAKHKAVVRSKTGNAYTDLVNTYTDLVNTYIDLVNTYTELLLF